MAATSINQGTKYNNCKQQLIEQGFTFNEGFVGILGSNYKMDEVINSDIATTTFRVTDFNNNIDVYNPDYQTLLGKTQSYLDDSDRKLDKNYNIFINQSRGPADITEINQRECVTRNSIRNLSLAKGFAYAYPQNFTNYTAAKNACKLWAADSGKTSFAIKKDTTGNYQCYTGTGLVKTITPNLKSATVYTILQGDSNTNQGGLFANGQIGVWSGISQSSINTVNLVPTGYEKCHQLIGGGIVKASISASYGRNCSTTPPAAITPPAPPPLPSPVNLGMYQYTKTEATAVCSARGQRLCTKAELNNSDFCSCGWASDGVNPGYPMAHGDKTPQGYCGGYNGGQVWRDCGLRDWLNPDGTIKNWGKKADGNRHASTFCCNK